MIELNYILASIIVIVTAICAKVALKNESNNMKIFVLFFFFFVLLYSGIGGALKTVPYEYTFFYLSFIIIFTIVFKWSTFYFKFNSSSIHHFSKIIIRNSNRIILIYFSLRLLSLAYPENHLSYLISPPPPSLVEHDFSEEGGTANMDAITALIYFAVSILIPFFYWALYRYQDKPKYVVILLIINLYLTYCNSGYVGRGTILFAGIIAFISVYRVLSPKKKKRLLISLAIITPFILFGFYNYSLIRLGQNVSSDSIMAGIEILFSQEIGYPTLYEDYIKLNDTYIYDYFEWLILLPLPGFLKFGLGNFALNILFSIKVLGIDPSDQYFFVLLPGVIGESIFVFGPYLFWINAIILSLIVRCVMNTLDEITSMVFVFYYYMIQFSFMMARAGTISIYPSVFKFFLLLILFLYLNQKKRIKYN